MAANFPTSDPSFTKKDYVNRETPLVADYNQALEEIEAIGSWILSTSPLNILRTDNTTEFTPTANYHPATKKYVDDNAGGLSLIQNGSFEIVDSSTVPWCWEKVGSATLAQDTGVKDGYGGSLSLKVTSGGTNNEGAKYTFRHLKANTT